MNLDFEAEIRDSLSGCVDESDLHVETRVFIDAPTTHEGWYRIDDGNSGTPIDDAACLLGTHIKYRDFRRTLQHRNSRRRKRPRKTRQFNPIAEKKERLAKAKETSNAAPSRP